MQNSFIWWKVSLQMIVALKSQVVVWHLWLYKEPVVLCGNLNVRQAMLQQVFKVTTFCTDKRFQVFSPLINHTVHHSLLKFSPWFSKLLPKLVCIAHWYLVYTHLHHAPDAVNQLGVGHDCWLATCQDWWTGTSYGAEAWLCHECNSLCIITDSISISELGKTLFSFVFHFHVVFRFH